MNLHEFQAKQLINQYGIETLKFQCVSDPKESKNKARLLGGSSWILKAQVHAGGRGKAGGIKKAGSLDEVEQISQNLIGKKLVTAQTDEKGEKILRILIEPAAQIEKEFYLAFLINRKSHCISLIASSEGGVDIEQTAQKNPEKIARIDISPAVGFCSYQARICMEQLNLHSSLFKDVFKLLKTLYSLFVKEDLSLLEINPLVLTKDKKIIPLDAKISLDSNAQFRHPSWKNYLLSEDLKSSSIQAQVKGFSFVRLPGNIGCMVNGAGLAMATMDMIQLYGGKPANFLDVGGDADADRIQTAFQFILDDSRVQGLLVNIFGGIVRCDLIAQGIITAAQKLKLTIPIVVRLEGNSADVARKLLEQSKLNIVSSEGLKSAAQKIISLTAKNSG